ncbi:ethyl tert-butyl ether degradation protein EthD [Paraburkholderia acidisoli]|uniref:Ethyl tert-butyl ether degradation protein EthD n=2 Tax=Paraburkholderia acidisoli TaxID=2571748 RepID=A0A7Z2GS21_9BURK|nr:ethyl tert-butyl ether degradation protein EthD [Paraburkholderia acidisoli]
MPLAPDPHIAANHDTTHGAPPCVVQAYFSDLCALEAALECDGALHRALQRAAPAAPAGVSPFTQQTMAVRRYAPLHARALDAERERCTYLVGYAGPADDFNAWLTHYLQHHPPLMLQLPGLRELEICTRLDVRSGLPYAFDGFMQRNKVVFDDAAALARALASPVRDAMREHFHALPPFQGAAPHFPMRSCHA